jgi:hypothetical protein
MIEFITGAGLVLIVLHLVYREGYHKGQLAAYDHSNEIMKRD